MPNSLESSLRFSLVLATLVVVAACNKSNSQSEPLPPKEAKVVIETVESDLHTFVLLNDCKMKVDEKPSERS